MEIKLFTIAMMVAFIMTAMTKVQAQNFEGPCLPSMHGLDDHQSAFCGSILTQTIALSAGWNWISLYVEVEDPIEMLQQLETALGDNATFINASEMFTEYLGDGLWIGDLDDEGLTNEQMYMIEAVTDCEIQLEGTPADPANYTIDINPGWNWIGFPSTQELSVEQALADFVAEDEDQLANGDIFSEYYGMWIGDVETLVPGQGYMYYSNSTQPKTLIFSTTSNGKSVFLRKQKE